MTTDSPQDDNADELIRSAESRPVALWLNIILKQGIVERATHIYLEQRDGDSTMRFRIDGLWLDRQAPKRELAPGVFARIKILALIDFASDVGAEQGNFRLRVAGRILDFRVSLRRFENGEGLAIAVSWANASQVFSFRFR